MEVVEAGDGRDAAVSEDNRRREGPLGAGGRTDAGRP